MDDVLPKIMEYAGNPALTILFIILWDRYQQRRNGQNPKDLMHHLDLAMTGHFDQLRRDLSETIRYQGDQAAKSMENAITKLLLQDALRRRDK